MAECRKTADGEAEAQKPWTDAELRRQIRLLRQENERLRKELENCRKTLPPKERLYDRVNVSVKLLDAVIVILFILLGLLLLMGIISAAL